MDTPREGGAEVYGGPTTWTKSMFANVEKGLLVNPHGPAVIAMHQKADHLSGSVGSGVSTTDRHLVWSYTQMHRAALKLCAALRFHGVHAESTIITLIPNRAEWALLYWTSTIFKFTLCSLDNGALSHTREAELQNLITLLKPAVIVVANIGDVQAVDKAVSSSGHSLWVKIYLDPDDGQTSAFNASATVVWKSLGGLLAEGHDLSNSEESALLTQAREEDPERIAWICFTSGTSAGKPKGCPMRVAAATYSERGTARYECFEPTSRYLMGTSNFRVVAPTLTLTAWCAGASIVMPSATFSSSATLDAIETGFVSHCVFMPALLHATVDEPSFASRDVKSVKVVNLGGDIITKGLLLKAARAFPSARVLTTHGMSEGGGFFRWPFGLPEKIPYFGDISPLGIASPGARIRVYDLENESIAKCRQLGEVQYSAPQITHYLGSASSDAFYEDGVGSWFKTSDLGFIDDQGVVYIVGRMTDRIKRAGIPITPAALEDCIGTYIGSQTSVIGVTHPILGHEPFAVVQTLGTRSAGDVMQRILDVFGKDYALGGVATLEDLRLSDFPLNSTGKIMKPTLLDIVERHQGR